MRISIALAKSKIQRGKRLFISQRHVDNAVQVNAFGIRRHNGDSHARIYQTDDGRQLLDFSGYLRPKSRTRTQTKNLPVKTDAGLARIHDERLVPQITNPDRPFLREGMIICHRRHQGSAIPLFDQYPGRGGHIRFAKYARVERPIVQTIELIERRHFMKRQQNMRKSRLELLDCPCQRRGEHCGRCVAEMQ
jgi:hypothetical protein